METPIGLPKISVAQTLADKIVALEAAALPAITTRKCEDMLIGVVGLCVTARNEGYVANSLQGCDDDGFIRATMKDGSVIEERQPYLRGGAREPLTRQDVIDKFVLNAEHGGWSKAQGDAALKLMAALYNGRIDLSSLRG